MKKIFLITIYLFINFHFLAQNSYWQQEIKYDN